MTLKEKLRQNLTGHLSDEKTEVDVNIAEKIADEHAIGFAEWLYRYDNTRLPNGNWIIKLGLKPYTSEEVLEIYKKTL
jgi:hypothetical protein